MIKAQCIAPFKTRPEMKKAIKITLYSLAGLIVLIIIGSYISYWSFSPEVEDVVTTSQNTSYFTDSYDECRSDFIRLADQLQKEIDSTTIESLTVQSKVDQNLTIDICYIPPVQDAGKLFVMSSGVHGIEGYTGSAIQKMFMSELIPDMGDDRPGILLIHGMNPYGFKYKRRVTENNVDLNRNSSVSIELYSTENSGYADLYNFINPLQVASTSNLFNRFFYVVAIVKIVKSSMPVLRQAVLQGQYQFPEGLYFGGTQPEPQIVMMNEYLPQYFDKYDNIFLVDLHTGYGEIGKLHLFTNPVEDDNIKELTETIFEGYEIDWGDSGDFYTVNGDFCSFMGDINPEATYISMPFEFGTLNSQVTFGSLHSIQKTIIENQGIQHGYKNNKQEKKIKSSFIEMYYPSDPAWKSTVIEQSREVLSNALENYMNIK